VSIVKELGGYPAGAGRRRAFIFPHAPMRPVTINNGMVMRAWYDVKMADLLRLEDDAGNTRARRRRSKSCWAREKQRGVAAHRYRAGRLLRRAGRSPCQTGLRIRSGWPGLWCCLATCRWPSTVAAKRR